ncbi:MAG: pilus assembly protein HicB [Bacteroidales bacterium]|nr:pilus assembly protein HicB [Bacteroidales bacterium]MCM1148150.1 pilus assembly protein HicB [Bacteroidales bacterium]MCM1207123.1 pilus assembly protein HicB [Bacillota bacterium]MCM1510875.1 hypothetical protein [Clostridium sp.]
MERFIVSVEKDTDGTYIAYNTNGDGFALIGRGNTVSEAKADFENSMKEVAESECERTGNIPEILSSAPEYKFSITSLFEYYSVLNVSAFARYIGINETLMRQYRKGDTYISEKRLREIENGIHRLGEELTGLRLI